jgi:DNA-binding transcriptional MerR regulator
MQQTEPTFMTSSGISILCGVPWTSVVHYSNIGVLKPVRDSAGRRLFTMDDVTKLIAYRAAKAAKSAARKKRAAAEVQAA